MNWFFALVIMTIPLVLGEVVKKFLSNAGSEISRKFVHISASLCAATLPLLLNLEQIAILALIMTPAMFYMHKHQILKSMSSRSHKSYGDVFFGLGCASAALIANSVPIYITAVLIMGLADGLSGLINPKSSFTIITPGAKKPLYGRAVFMMMTCVIMLIASSFINFAPPKLIIIIFSSFFMTVIEQVSPYGSDNFTIPVVAALLLNSIQV